MRLTSYGVLFCLFSSSVCSTILKLNIFTSKKNLSSPCCFQEPLILERKGIKIGFLGYCHIPSPTIKKNCTEMRMLFNSGPAIYRDDIATQDVQHLKKVLFKLFRFDNNLRNGIVIRV